MSRFDVTFYTNQGRGASTLEGPGTISIEATGVRLEGTRPRTVLVAILSGTVAFVATFFAILAAMSAFDGGSRASVDMRLFVAIGLVVAVGVFLGIRRLLTGRLRPRRFAVDVPLAQVMWVRPRAEGLELYTTARRLLGPTLFLPASDADRGRVQDEVAAAKHGAQPGYR